MDGRRIERSVDGATHRCYRSYDVAVAAVRRLRFAATSQDNDSGAIKDLAVLINRASALWRTRTNESRREPRLIRERKI